MKHAAFIWWVFVLFASAVATAQLSSAGGQGPQIHETAGLPTSGGTLTGNVLLQDDVELQLGTGTDFKQYFDSADNRFYLESSAGYVLQIFAASRDLYFGGNTFMSDSRYTLYGSGGDVRFGYNTTQTPDAMFMGVSTDSRNFILMETGDFTTDFGYALSANPTLYIASSDETTPAKHLRLTHDETDGVITAGAGGVRVDSTLYADEVGAYGSVSMYDVSDPYGEGAGGTVNIDASGATGNCSAATAWVLISDATDCVAGTLFNFTNSNCVLTASRTHRTNVQFHISFDGSSGNDIYVGVADNASLPPAPMCQTKRDASSAGSAGSASGACDILATATETLSLYYCNQTTVTNDINITRLTLEAKYLGDD